MVFGRGVKKEAISLHKNKPQRKQVKLAFLGTYFLGCVEVNQNTKYGLKFACTNCGLSSTQVKKLSKRKFSSLNSFIESFVLAMKKRSLNIELKR